VCALAHAVGRSVTGLVVLLGNRDASLRSRSRTLARTLHNRVRPPRTDVAEGYGEGPGAPMLTTTITAASIAAIAGSPHCIGMCGPLACAAGTDARAQVAYHVGRIGTYVTLGALAGAIGSVAPLPAGVATGVAAILLVVFSLSLAGLLPEPRALPGLARLGARFASQQTVPSRLAFGVVNGLLPCGLVYATLALPMAAADPFVGAVGMGVFGLLTVPALAAAAFGLRAVLNRTPAVRGLLASAVLVSGLFALGLRDGWFVDPADPDEPAVCHVPQ